jgi:hypothetical protein
MVSFELLFVSLFSRTKTRWLGHRLRQKGGAAAGPKIRREIHLKLKIKPNTTAKLKTLCEI